MVPNAVLIIKTKQKKASIITRWKPHEQQVVEELRVGVGGAVGEQDDLRVHHQDVQRGRFHRRPQHIDQVLKLTNDASFYTKKQRA